MQPADKFVVGLTGGIGSGKSAAAEVFKSLGVEVVDADALAREVVEPGQPALAAIAKRFGNEILTKDGTLDRASLRTLIFSQPEHKVWLEKLLHPLIYELLRVRLDNISTVYAVLESPLLFETDQHSMVDRALVIDVSEETQLERSLDRDGGDRELIESIIASQIEREERLRLADDVVDNEADLKQLKSQIEKLHEKYQRMTTDS